MEVGMGRGRKCLSDRWHLRASLLWQKEEAGSGRRKRGVE